MLKLLMVDDEKWVRERFSDRIPWSDAGFTFMGAASGADEAIGMIEREMPHLLLTDITMPNMNGLELAAYVRKRWPRIRIVILTAYGEFEFARQAIELGVDHYLIKLAQTPEIILDICRKVAADIEREMDVDHKLKMRLKLEKENEWTKKQQWTKRLLNEEGSDNVLAVPTEWFGHMERAGSWANLTLGWSMSGGSSEAMPSEEEFVQLQIRIGETLEKRLDGHAISVGCQFVLMPLPLNRMGLLVASNRPLSALHMNQLATIALEVLKAFAISRSFIYGSPVRESGKEPVTAKRIADRLREGLEGLAGYFYKPESAIVGKNATPYRRLDTEQARERVAAMVKALQRENSEAFEESASVMTRLYDPLILPSDLLRLTKQMFNPDFVHLPSSVIARLSAVNLIETWADYIEWWTETINAIKDMWSSRANQNPHVRKEIQIILRHIREHYKEDVQVAELAKLVQMHPSYAGQMFKQEVGENFSDYLNRVRMEKASELLERTTMKIYEVSGAVGISDYRYFCKLFKSQTGFTPTQYKNKQP
ncbi:response regulator [Cohnella suwonensis]|uniref:Response regulator n=1 Tax=Cohnella suwonensis TaxID=696072 RepID=A0ABW0M0V3_9BACL